MNKPKTFMALNLEDLKRTAKDGHGRPMNRTMVQIKTIQARDIDQAKELARSGNTFTWAVIPKKVIDRGITAAY